MDTNIKKTIFETLYVCSINEIEQQHNNILLHMI